MGRTATKSFEAIAAFLKDFAAKPLTTTQIVDGLGLCPSLPSLSQPTVNRCLNSDAAPFYGIVLAKVPGTSRNHFTYDANVAKRASELVVNKTSKEYLDSMLLTVDHSVKAKRAVEVLNANGIDALAELDEAIRTKSEWFVTDEFEQQILIRFRTLRVLYGNEERLSQAFAASFDGYMNNQTFIQLAEADSPLFPHKALMSMLTSLRSPEEPTNVLN